MLLYVYVGILGAIFASFVNVVVYRYPKGMQFVKGRSHCPYCHATLDWIAMTPILGWFICKGKCRYCHSTISLRYPLVETMGAVFMIMAVSCFGLTVQAICISIIFMVLLCIAWIDVDTLWISNDFLILLMILAVWLTFYQTNLSFMNHLLGSISAACPMLLLNLIVKDSFGGGDIKLMFICGWMLGMPCAVVADLIAVFSAGLYACYLLFCKRIKRYDHIAFGPFLCLGIVISMCYGMQLLEWYLLW
ncbi:MAG: prepilin peptidase [Erysipelotrichaceae bacterium]|nr:prepilin peptidase [Erysipelotrichaceae bacterium]